MKNLRSILALCALCLTSSLAFAHPPSNIKIQFDEKTKVLTATIKHRVSNPATHYINKVDIGLNGKEIRTLAFDKQESNAAQTITVEVPEAKTGDVLSVEGYCNLSGKLEKEIALK